jgi:hypothetical protein
MCDVCCRYSAVYKEHNNDSDLQKNAKTKIISNGTHLHLYFVRNVFPLDRLLFCLFFLLIGVLLHCDGTRPSLLCSIYGFLHSGINLIERKKNTKN